MTIGVLNARYSARNWLFWILVSLLQFYHTLGSPYHFKYDIPTLLYNPNDTSSSTSVPFNSFTQDEKTKEINMLYDLNRMAQSVVGVYPPFMARKRSQSSHHNSASSENNAKAAEYYRKRISRSVVVTVANMGYLHHLRNFECFARRLQMNYLVLAVDDSLVNALQEDADREDSVFKVLRYPGRWTNPSATIKPKTPPPPKVPFYKPKSGKKTNTSSTDTVNEVTDQSPALDSAAGFQSAAFNLISLRKFEAVYDLQRLGYNVLFIDIDVIVLQDVFHVFLRPHLASLSYLHSMNLLCEAHEEDADYLSKSMQNVMDGNTGFHYFQFPAYIAKKTVIPTVNSLNIHGHAAAGHEDVSESEIKTRLVSLLQVTDTLPSVQLLYHFLRYIPHDPLFNPNEAFDDQTLFWRFLRAVRSDVNPNIGRSLNLNRNNSSLLAVTGLGLCDNLKKSSPSMSIKLCGLNSCQFSAGAFIHYKHLLHHGSKRLDTLSHIHAVQNQLPPEDYTILRTKQPNYGPVIQVPNNITSVPTATHRLLPRHQKYIQHLLFDYLAPHPRFYTPAGVSSQAYLYSLHGNYITGAVDKQQVVVDAGFWLLQELTDTQTTTTTAATSTTTSRNSAVKPYRCLQFPHDLHGHPPGYPLAPPAEESSTAETPPPQMQMRRNARKRKIP